MSLTSELRTPGSKTRIFFDLHFPNLKPMARKFNEELKQQSFPVDAPYESAILYAVSGTAIDYRIRAYFSPDFYTSPAITGGLKRLETTTIGGEINPFQDSWRDSLSSKQRTLAWRLFDEISEELRKLNSSRTILDKKDNLRVCTICVLLASIDNCSRGDSEAISYLSKIGSSNLEEMISKIDQKISADVVRITDLFAVGNFGLIASVRNTLCGVKFDGSDDIGGADCDLICDGVLIECKSLKKPKFNTDYFRQLVGYYLLDYNDKMSITEFRVYFSRHAHWLTIDLKVVFAGKDISKLRGDFKKEMQQLRKQREERWKNFLHLN